jgi:hypothetical protein
MKDERFNSNIITPLRLVIGYEILIWKKKFKTMHFLAMNFLKHVNV